MSPAQWQCACVPPEPAQTAQHVGSYLLLAGHGEEGQEHSKGDCSKKHGFLLFLNSHLSYTGITTSSGTKVVTNILRAPQEAEVVMATTLRSQFSLLRVELGKQSCLVSSITKCGNINERVCLRGRNDH